jgi:hypothetical protein
MMKRTALVLATCLSLMLTVGVASASNVSDIPKDGFVPNQETAVRVAEAILVPIYGKNAVEREKPFTAQLSGNVWTVTGTLPKEALGGVATVEIAKDTGCILRVAHGK